MAIAACCALLLSADILHAQPASASSAASTAGVPATAMPPILREVGFDQNLGNTLPLDLDFRDEHGSTVTLGEYFGKRPVVLGFVYFSCPILCSQVIASLASSVGVVSLAPGNDFELVLVSFDPRDTPADAAEKKSALVGSNRRLHGGRGWHFLTGRQDVISRLATAAGFRYVWDDTAQQYAHPAGIVVVTPDGRVARYLFGIEYGPRDLRLALIEAANRRIGSRTDSLLLYCYHYDLATGRYTLAIMRLVRIGGAATVFCISGLIFVLVRRERRGLR